MLGLMSRSSRVSASRARRWVGRGLRGPWNFVFLGLLALCLAKQPAYAEAESGAAEALNGCLSMPEPRLYLGLTLLTPRRAVTR